MNLRKEIMNEQNTTEQKARRAARKAGFTIVDPYYNSIVGGSGNYENTAQDVIKYCKGHTGALAGSL